MADKKHFLAEIEEQVLDVWEKENTFEQSIKNRKNADRFTFYDGPPFANGVPHYGHLVQTTIKDSVTRYKTMRGYYVPRRVGWDTHGLPVEYAIEKKHGFKGKRDIVEFGIDKFNAECRESVFEYKDIWENMFRRVGRWADYEHTYATLDESYIESVWWVFKSLYDKGYVYKDFRSSPYCPRCATPLSNFELNQGYQDDIEDPSLFVKFFLKNDSNSAFLSWTTTPWTLPANAALAVDGDAEYVTVELLDHGDSWRKGQKLILAKNRLRELDLRKAEYKIARTQKGSELEGLEYIPLYDSIMRQRLSSKEERDSVYRVYVDKSVSLEDGTGILHVAPNYGETDLELGKRVHLPLIQSVDANGKMMPTLDTEEGLMPVIGKFFKNADPLIIEDLTKKGLIFAAEKFKHTYPFCWRCDTPLLYYATDSWLVSVTKVKDQLIANNKKINWTPEHIRDGRFGKWLENARDWAISRNRFWGAPLPIWITDDGEVVVVGSVEELKSRAVNPEKISDLHRPYVDDIEIKTDSGKIAKRIPEVFDCWFESGSMPYAEDHYPFKNKEQWEQNFPADFIAEAIDQTRGWFYTLHVLASALFDKPAFKNVICSGWVVAADGQKLSKRKKNYAPMDEVFDQYGVDTMRFFMASSPIVNGEDVRFSVDFLRDVQRNVFMTLNNVFSFYKLYADIDKWHPENPLQQSGSTNVLDKWMIARLNQVTLNVTEGMEEFRLDRAVRPVGELLDDISNWYVRRSRRRFWKTKDDTDKHQAYETLHYVILRTCQLLAPFSPFLPEYIWRQMVQGTELPKSVHLTDWPSVNKQDAASLKLLENMKSIRALITEGLSQRAKAGIKVRQPLGSATVYGIPSLEKDFIQIIKEELNVKEVKLAEGGEESTNNQDINLDINVTPDLKEEGIARELVRIVQNARKNAGFNVDDRIKLLLQSDAREITDSAAKFSDMINTETLTTGKLEDPSRAEHSETVKVDAQEVTVSLAR
jgi:isoleucyl-tRNA synthetase